MKSRRGVLVFSIANYLLSDGFFYMPFGSSYSHFFKSLLFIYILTIYNDTIAPLACFFSISILFKYKYI